MPWGVAVALGAIVAPTDPVAFLTVARRLNVSPRLVGLLDGENLLNDFTALVVYTTAVQATLDGTFSPAHSLGELVWTAAVGVALGYAVGRTVSFVNARVDDPITAPIIVLCGCYLAFLPAEALHVSAILAAGVAGRVIGARPPVVDLPRTRLTGYGFWNTWIFLLTAVLFMLIGLQLSVVVDALPDTPAKVTAYCLACAATVIVLRMLFILTMGLTVPPIARRMRLDGARPWAESLVAGWAGMRGVICLVMALALPADFPYRPIVLVCTFAVILITLVGQGLTLPWLIHHTPVERDTLSAREQEELRERTQRAAEARLGELEASGRVSPATAAALRTAHRATAPPDPGDEALARLRLDLIAAERQEAIRLRREGRYGDEVLREHERCLDLRATLITESSHATDRHTATTHARPGQETDPG
ncbi:cation:proton antiporter [Streptomyces sp. SudanB25_2051]|uniref:cation:proton antiporter n=1 Tax=Streptomyces sp. SudanB25_2051 TaxID=3035275 RepID=UPI003F57CE9A